MEGPGPGDGRQSTICTTGPLIGRDDEVSLVVDLVRRSDVPVVTLTGPSGVGKTSLGLVTLDRLRPVAGVVVPLAPVRDPALMRDAVVEAVLGTHGHAGGPADALWERFAGAPVVLLLDNVEQIAGAGRVVADLTRRYSAATVLCTSLRPSGAPGEQVVRLRPLAVPEEGGAAEAGGSAPALTLFLRRATAVDATLGPDADWVAAAAEVCRLVGGLPLAIELAAARVASIPPALMAEQLARPGGLGLLRRPFSTAPNRHDSLGSALRWTVDLLAPQAAELLATMSVFEGPACLDGVSAVSPAGAQVLDPLSDLVDLHLVEIDGSDPSEPRFWLLPPVRSFARELLVERGGSDDAVARLDTWVRARARSGADWSTGQLADLLAAMDRARLAGEVDSALDLALQVAAGTASPGAEATVGSRVEDLLRQPGRDHLLRAQALVWTATHGPTSVLDRQAFAEWTRQRVQNAISSARSAGDPGALMDALELTVRTLSVTLDRDLALSGIREGVAIAQRCDDPARLARFRMWSGMAAQAAGYGDQGRALLRQAWESGSEAGDRVAADYAAMFLHAAAVQTGLDHESRLPQLTDLLSSAWQNHDLFQAAYVLSLLVTQSLADSDVVSAARYLGQMLPIGVERHDVEPLMAARILAEAVRVFVAAARIDVGTRVQRSLDPLDPVLRNSMSTIEYAAYANAVSALPQREPVDENHPAPMSEGLRLAEQEVWAMVAASGPQTPPSPDADDTAAPTASLTERQREVLALLADGAGNKEIARRLGITPKTVMHHTMAIYRKLGVRGRAEAAALAVRSNSLGPAQSDQSDPAATAASTSPRRTA